MTDLIDELRDWYADIPGEGDTSALIATALPAGRKRRRRQRVLAGTAVMLSVALIGVIVAGSADSPSHQVRVVATTAVPASVHDATEGDFPDLSTLRAWLVPIITRSASRPASVHAQI